MRKWQRIAVLLPALNEERAIGSVLAALPWSLLANVTVVDNGSKDATADRARAAGASVIHESRRGYGAAMAAGIAHLERAAVPPDIVIFLDADASDDPALIPEIVGPILEDRADFVIGSRERGMREPGALPFQARWGNRLACFLIRILTGVRFTDLGPFRAIRLETLRRLNMVDRGFGWTVEMQVKAARAGLRIVEIPVPYRRRIGKSKISGTLSGSIRAGVAILWTIARHARFSMPPKGTGSTPTARSA